MLTRKQIALVHVACKDLGIGEDDRHRIQETVTGKESLKVMDQHDFEELVRHFEGKGFSSPFTVHRSHRGVGPYGPEAPFSDGQRTTDNGQRLINKIYSLWHQLEGSYYEPRNERRALRGFLKKRFHIDHEKFLDVETAIKVIEAVKAIISRCAVKEVWD